MNQDRHSGVPTHPYLGGRGLRRWLLAGVVAASGSFGAAAFAQHGGMQHGGPGMGTGAMFMAQPEHMNRMLDRWLDGVNASDEQRAQIRQIALAAGADLRAQREAGRALRAQSLQLFAAPTIDDAAAESLRQRMLVQHEQASRRVTQAMLDTAKVLTPEQRVKMVERMQQRGERMRERSAPGNS